MDLNEQQVEAVTSTATRLHVAAAPGSGKTTVLVRRIAHALENGWCGGSEVLAVTFTNKAAGEIRSRLEGTRHGSKIRAMTLHGWCATSIRELGHHIGRPPDFSVRDEADRDDIIRHIGAEFSLRHKTSRRLWKEAPVRRRYWEVLREQNALDYDGLETEMLRLMANATALQQLRDWHRFVLVDEHQDSSERQQQILDLLRPKYLTVVGDHGQSIYSFRAAHPEGFTDLPHRPGWASAELSTNYRSVPGIVDAVSRLAQRMAPPGMTQTAARAPGRLVPVSTVAGIDERDMLDMVTDDLVEARLAGVALHECAVLSPVWSLLHSLGENLNGLVDWRLPRRAAVAVESEEGRWLAHGFQLIHNPNDWTALRHLANWPTQRLTVKDVAVARSQVLRGRKDTRTARQALAVRSAAVRATADMAQAGTSPLAALQRLAATLDQLLVERHLEERRRSLADATSVFEDVLHRHPDWKMVDLVDWYAMRAVDDFAADTENKVSLYTIHAAKGLQWRHVWILGCQEGLMPRGAAPEGRRMFYVALSRAQDTARICYHHDQRRSRFVTEATGRS